MDGVAQTSTVTGNGTVTVASPYCPVDYYNTNNEAGKPDGVIQDLDLLRGIDKWAVSGQFIEYGGGWPSNPGTMWDNIILAVIDIWASPAGTQGYHSGGQASAASTVAGEYQFVGPNTYKKGAAGTPVAEMYWTQGAWSD